MKSTFKIKTLLFITFFLCLFAGVFAAYYFNTFKVSAVSSSRLEDCGIDRADKLMIVAHPDDETLWGGAHLMEKGYFIVVLTNENTPVRKKEFQKLLKASGNEGIILSYPDKFLGKKASWKHNTDGIRADLEKIIGSREWSLIVTHNPDGEYGHIHHKNTSSIVTDICKEQGLTPELFYFGRYYTKNMMGKMESLLPRISDEELAFKEKLLTIYKSQSDTVEMFSHMNHFENWYSYQDIAA